MKMEIPDLTTRRVGVTLSSAFFGFFAHTGFLAALEQMGVTVRAITGASAGALVGALYASGMSSTQMAEVLTSTGLSDFVDIARPWDLLKRPFGILRGDRLERSLERYSTVTTFEQCRIPFGLTTYDLDEAEHKVIDSGPLIPALRAALSLPGMFQPTDLDGHLCWDGGVAEKLPISFLADRDDIDTIIACYVEAPGSHKSPPRSLFSGLRTAMMSLIRPSDQSHVDEARARGKEILVVSPSVPACGPHRLAMGSRIIDLARRDTLRILEEGDLGHPNLR